MKVFHILMILTLIAVGLFVNANAQSDNSTVQYVPLKGSALQVALNQGNSTDFPVQVRIPSNYKITNLLIMLSPWLDGIYATATPQLLHDTYSTNVTLQVYVQPYVKPGNYTMNIVAQGWVNDITTGKEFMVNSEPPVPLTIKVLPHNGRISISLGKMTDKKIKTYCYNHVCSNFTATESFQILLKSKNNDTILLDTPDVPVEKWINFVPSRVNVGSQGAHDTMTIAGMVGPLTANPVSGKIFTIRAETEDGSDAQTFFPYEDISNMSVLHFVEPINFTNKFLTNVNDNDSDIYGVVYDPATNGSIPVSLSVAGIQSGNTIIPLLPSIDVEITHPSFVLNASQVYYIPVIVKTSSAPIGTYHIAINEIVGGKQFISIFPLTVMEPDYSGPSGAYAPQPTLGESVFGGSSSLLSYLFAGVSIATGIVFIMMKRKTISTMKKQ